MRDFEAKTLNDALTLASKELGIELEDLIYEVVEEKKGLFRKIAIISVYETTDIVDYATWYLTRIISAFDISPKISQKIDGSFIKLEVDTNHNSIIIGKNGYTLAAINDLVKLALSVKFKKRIKVVIDINDYKNQRYNKVIALAKRVAKDVRRTKVSATLTPMRADERKAVHNALTNWDNIKTESVGEQKDRAITIIYVE